jgi:hypothetical protein
MSLKQAGMAASAAILIILGLGCCQLNIHDIQRLVFDGYYISAELEVLKYDLKLNQTGFGSPGNYRHGKGTMQSGPSRIEGTLHPDGNPVVTNDRDLNLARFDKSGGVLVDLPLPNEVEGQRLPVFYWAGDPADRRWYHPPLVHNATRPSTIGTVISLLLCVGMLFGAACCIRYVYDPERAKRHHLEEQIPSRWPAWTFLVFVGCVITYPLLGLMIMARTTGYTRTSTGRVPWTVTDWAASVVLIGIVAIVPILLTLAIVYAIRKRLAHSASSRQL